MTTMEEYVEESMRNADDFLQHYGIKGMKWGRRRSREELASVRSLPDADDHTRARKLHTTAKLGGTRKLSNKDIEDLNKRLNLEQNYRNLTSKKPQTNIVAKGAGWMAGKLLKIGDLAVDEVTKAHVRVALNQKGFLPQVPKGNN